MMLAEQLTATRALAARTARALYDNFLARPRAERVAIVGLAGLLTFGVLLRLGLMYAVRPALLGYSDTHVYLYAAAQLDAGRWFASQHQPNGYPLFVQLSHLIAAKLPVLILLQHVLGIASAVLVHLTVRRAGGPAWLGLVPAAVLLLGGFQLFAEHTPISEPLFTFIVAASLYAGVRAMDAPRAWWPALVGLLMGLAPTVRTMGLTLVPVMLLWFLFEPGQEWRARALRAGAYVALAAMVLGAYVVGQSSVTGYTGLTRTGIWNLYGRAAPFADCTEFTVPQGTEELCQTIPERQRPAVSQYVYDINVSPGLAVFSGVSAPTQQGGDEVGAFARAAIVGQPLDYLEDVANDMLRYVIPSDHTASGGLSWEGFADELTMGTNPPPEWGARPPQPVDYRPYYPRPGLLQRDGLLELYRDWERATRIDGLAMVVAFGLALIAPLATPQGRPRRVATLLSVVTLILMVTPVATLYYNARFTIPVFGPLVAAAALGGWGLMGRRRRRNLEAG